MNQCPCCDCRRRRLIYAPVRRQPIPKRGPLPGVEAFDFKENEMAKSWRVIELTRDAKGEELRRVVLEPPHDTKKAAEAHQGKLIEAARLEFVDPIFSRGVEPRPDYIVEASPDEEKEPILTGIFPLPVRAGASQVLSGRNLIGAGQAVWDVRGGRVKSDAAKVTVTSVETMAPAAVQSGFVFVRLGDGRETNKIAYQVAGSEPLPPPSPPSKTIEERVVGLEGRASDLEGRVTALENRRGV